MDIYSIFVFYKLLQSRSRLGNKRNRPTFVEIAFSFKH